MHSASHTADRARILPSPYKRSNHHVHLFQIALPHRLRDEEARSMPRQSMAGSALGIHGRNDPRAWSVPHGVGGFDDHVHLLVDLTPKHVFPDVVRELKKASTAWIRNKPILDAFQWQEGYGIFTVGWREKQEIKNYIAGQERHHGKKTFRVELIDMLNDAGVEFDPKYLP